MKSPPQQLRDSIALDACDAFIDGRPFPLPRDGARDAKLVVGPG
jgi:hypothetical protein